MKIYTRTGDDGTTALFGGKRVAKNDDVVCAYGTVDELTSSLGVVCPHVSSSDKDILTRVQKTLYAIMASVAGAKNDLSMLQQETKTLEKDIDVMTAKLPPLHKFILPQGPVPVAEIHLCRAICRRAERALVGIHAEKSVIMYINRLSDYLFTLARWYGRYHEVYA